MSQGTSQRVDVVIVTAIPLEYETVLKVDAGAVPGSVWREAKQPNGVAMAYRAFEVPKGRPLEVAVAVAPDMATAAALATLIPLIEKLEPRCIAMCGVCAGRPGKVQLGDVIAAERLYYHDTGKQTHEKGKPEKLEQDLRIFNLRPDWKSALELLAGGDRAKEHFKGLDWLARRPLSNEWRENRALLAIHEGAFEPWNKVDPDLKQSEWPKVVAALRKREWMAPDSPELTEAGRKAAANLRFEYPGTPDLSPHGTLRPFRLHVAPMASGNTVIEDEKIWDRLAEYERKILGLDMEAAALGAVGHYVQGKHVQDKRLSALVMKGVMDFANAGRDDHFKEFAARASAECLLWFLRDHVETGEPTGYEKILNPGVLPLPSGEVPPSKLLQARYGVVPWHDAGRAEQLQDLERWLEEPVAASAWLVHAEGGIGKTRLAIEWVRRRRERFDVAGFLGLPLPSAWLNQLTGFGRPVIIVIDYAESRGDLADRLREVAQLAGSTHRVRVLLLARNDGDWLQALLTQAPELEPLLTQKAPHQLEPLASRAPDRQKVLEEAVLAFASHWKLSVTLTPMVDLSDPIYSRALYLHMAALLAVEAERKPPLTGAVPAKLEATAVLPAVLDHEERSWLDGSAKPADWERSRNFARQIVVGATLRGGLDKEEVRHLAARLQRRESTDDEERVLVALRRLYQHQAPGAPYLPALEPDLLGEGMVLRLVQDRVTIKDDDWIERAAGADGVDQVITTAFTVLGRASVTDPDGARPWISRLLHKGLSQRATLALRAAKVVGTRTVHAVVGDVLAEQLEQAGTLAIARALGDEGIPRPSVSLARVAEWQSRIMLEGGPAAGSDDAQDLADRAHWLLQHGTDLSKLGQREAALATTQEAVGHYRALAERSPEAFLPDLASSLNNLGTMQSELGQREAALATTQEAVGHYRALAEGSPEAFLPDLAKSLTNLGNRQSKLGQREAALTTTQEAVGHTRALAEGSPEAFLPDLAKSLNNLGLMQRALGQREAALATTQEAVGHYRALAERSPEAFLPDLAKSLNNLGLMQRALGQREAALATTQEAVGHYRALAERSPEAFLPDLAMSLNNLGILQSALGQREAALATTQEAVGIRRVLADGSPEAFLPALAGSLTNLGNRQSELGQREAALTTTQEAVGIRRVLAEGSPEAFLPALAGSLTNLGNRQSELGQREAALATTQEAVGHYRALAERSPEAFLPDLAKSLNNLGLMQRALGQREAALTTTQEAVGIRRVLAEGSPEAFLPDLAKSLNNLGLMQRALGQREAALATTQEAVGYYRGLAEGSPEAFLPDLAGSLTNLGILQSALGQWEAALATTQEAVEHYRGLAEGSPEAFRPALDSSLTTLGTMQSELGQREAALATAQEAVEHYRGLAEGSPEAFRPALASSLTTLGTMQSELGQREAALATAQEAVGHYRALAERSPEAFLPDLAKSLNNLGLMQRALGQREAALTTTQEAVGIRRVLAEGSPEAFLPALAGSLNNLGILQSELGQREVALATTQEAVGHYRALTERSPEAFRPGLAISLTTLGILQSELGQWDAALATAAEAVALHRALTEGSPEAFRPALAGSLTNLGILLYQLGHGAEGHDAMREAESLTAHLAELGQS